jgi:hypothetical protein
MSVALPVIAPPLIIAWTTVIVGTTTITVVVIWFRSISIAIISRIS